MRGGSWATQSTQLDVGFFPHAAPQFHLVFYETAEFFRRVLPRDYVELFEALDHLLRTQRLVELSVELLYDRCWRAVRHEDAVPLVGLEALDGIGHRRDIWQAIEAAFAGMRDRLHLVPLDQADHRRPLGEKNLHLPRHNVGERRA